MPKYISIIFITFLFASCTKEIDIDLNSASPLLVIEGNISDEPGPYFVKLSKTVNFSDANIYPPVSGALVIISDNTGVVDTLTETIPGLYQTHSITGTQGNTYTLKVIAEGRQYNAVSIMPYKINLDSLAFNFESGFGADNYEVLPLFLDPVALGNRYRFILSVNGETDKSFYVLNDTESNGTINQQAFSSEEMDILEGDTVDVTMLCIDANTYTYYYSLAELLDSNPIFASTPANPPNNITGNRALGIFSAYTMQTKTAIAR